MRVSINEYAQHVKRAHVPVPEPYLLVRGGRCKVAYPWIKTCQGLGSKDLCPKKIPIVIQCSLQLCTSFAWATCKQLFLSFWAQMARNFIAKIHLQTIQFSHFTLFCFRSKWKIHWKGEEPKQQRPRRPDPGFFSFLDASWSCILFPL